jgi:spermidine synthase
LFWLLQKGFDLTQSWRFWQQVAVVFFIMLLASINNNMWDQSLFVFALKAIIMLAVFFVSAWACHQRLAGMRPPVSRLPQFYFIVALGGGLAGILHAFVIPYVLTNVYEFHIAVILSLLLNTQWTRKIAKFKIGNLRNADDWLAGVAVVLLVLIGLTMNGGRFAVLNGLFTVIFLFIFLLFSLQPKKLFMLCCGVFLVMVLTGGLKGAILQERNFFGVYRVIESADAKTGHTQKLFMHGNTWHGMAVLGKNGKPIREDMGYYVRKGPITDVLDTARARDLAVIGLGTGQLACFDKKVKTDFFEIDPDIVPIAEKHFPYLNDCKPRHIYIGDGRIELVKQKSSYDVVLLDAFTSDGIPSHLLTVDALEEYKSRLKSNGIALFHISNRYFKLAPPIAAIADQLGLKAYRKIYKLPKERLYEFQSDWVAVPLNAQQGKTLEQKGWEKVTPAATPWTDDKSSLISALSLTF